MENWRKENFAFNDCIHKVKGKVEVYREIIRGEYLVVKKIYVANIEEANSVIKSVYAMCALDHPSIAKVKAYCSGRNFGYSLVVMDYYSDGDLEKEIQWRYSNWHPWTNGELTQIFNRLLSGFTYMQNRNLIHRNITPKIILKKGNQYFISNFKFVCKSETEESNLIIGTPAYLSPLLSYAYIIYFRGENISNFRHNAYKSDVFSLGLTFYYMMTLAPFELFRAQASEDQFISYAQGQIMPTRYSDTLKNMVCSMLVLDENQRPDFLQLTSFYLAT